MTEGPTLFEKLTAVATLGTRRAPLPQNPDWPHESLAVMDADASAELKLLRIAAASALWTAAGTRAGSAPVSGVDAGFPAPPAREISEPAAWRLARIVGGEHPYLLSEWFELAEASERTLPPRWLPLVLEHVPPESRRNAAGVLGPAAPWLAARNPRWLVEAPAAPSELRWKEGSTAQRLVDLASVRGSDRQRSRDWLRMTWEQDPPEAREAFLKVLQKTVEPADEEFLEMALDDKRKAVRTAALDCLAQLPQSALVKRHIARTDPLLDLPDGSGVFSKLRQRKLQVLLPEAPDKTAQRDGIEARVPANRKTGERTYWLTQGVAFVPPAHWSARFACDPTDFLEAVAATDFALELLEALAAATARHPDPEWTLAIARALLRSESEQNLVITRIVSLAVAVPAGQRAAFFAAMVKDPRARSGGHAWALLSAVEARWDAELTREALVLLAQTAAGEKATWSQPRNALDMWARNCDRQAGAMGIAPLLEKFPDGHPWRNALEQFNDIVAFRAAMQEELKK
jgi:hypothetical protein